MIIDLRKLRLYFTLGKKRNKFLHEIIILINFARCCSCISEYILQFFTTDASPFVISHNTSCREKWRTCAPHDRQVAAAFRLSFASSGQLINFSISFCDTNMRNRLQVCRTYRRLFCTEYFSCHFSVSQSNRLMQVQQSRLVIPPFVFYLTMLLVNETTEA